MPFPQRMLTELNQGQNSGNLPFQNRVICKKIDVSRYADIPRNLLKIMGAYKSPPTKFQVSYLTNCKKFIKNL